MKKNRSLLISLLALLTLTACGGASETQQTPVTEALTPDDTAPVTEAETEDPLEPKLAPIDAGGRTFMFLYGDNEFEPNLDVCADAENGEPLNDSIYNRNRIIEEKYNVKVAWERYSSGGALTPLSKAVKAGDAVYDIYTENGVSAFSAAMQGLTQQLNDFPYIDYSKPYWNSGMLAGSSINNKNYFVYSDMNIHALGATPCVLFNKVVAQQFDINNLYEIVTDGKWTHEQMGKFIKMVTGDLDGDGKITEKDRLGFIGNDFVIDCFLSGTGYQTITKDEDDMPVLHIQTEEYYNIVSSIMTLCSFDNGSYICDRYKGVDREYAPMEALEEDRALFWIANLKGVERMRGMESPFGILPIPKLDEAQSDYRIHYQANIGGAMSVPITVSDRELTGAILEDMAYLSMKTVKPAYVDVLLQGKFLRDEESLVTLEIMFDSYYSDIGFMTGGSGISVLTELRGYIDGNRTDFVSRIEKKIKSYNKSLDKIKTTYLEERD